MSQKPLRIIGTPDTLIEAIRNRAESDLGFPISFEPLDGLKLQQRVVMSPESFDVMDHWSISAELAWAARAIQPIELDRIKEWRSILHEGSKPSFYERICIGKGAAPGRKLFVQDDFKLGQDPAKLVTMLPTVHNFDSFCYRPHLRNRYFPDKRDESWGWLLEPQVRGRVALSSHAPIAIIEAALAIEARQLMKFNDIGNLTISEIDRIIDILIELKRRRHFRAFWDSTEEAVNLMNQRDTDFASIWAQGLYQLRTKNKAIAYAVPKEGYRGWMDGLCLSSKLEGETLERAYAFMNWWQSGWAGSFMARHGIYMIRPDLVRNYLSSAEWDYWYDGKQASEDIQNNDGVVIVQKGELREGGSYFNRMSKVTVWNSVMDEHNYLTRKWNEFMSALTK